LSQKRLKSVDGCPGVFILTSNGDTNAMEAENVIRRGYKQTDYKGVIRTPWSVS